MSGLMNKLKEKLSGAKSGGKPDGHTGTTTYGKGIDKFEKASGYDVPDKYEDKLAKGMEGGVDKYKAGHSGGGGAAN